MIPMFIYGTLKRGHSRAHVLADQTFVRTARTVAAYRLYDCRHFPALVEDREYGIGVEGELWQINPALLPTLDKIEAVDEGLYVRGSVQLEGVPARAAAYLYNRSVAGLACCGSRWSVRGERSDDDEKGEF